MTLDTTITVKNDGSLLPVKLQTSHRTNKPRCTIDDRCCFQWLSVVSMFLIYMISGGIQYSIGIMFVVVMDIFDASRSNTVVISSVWLFVAFAMCYPSGVLVERKSTRCVGVLGAVIGFISFISSAFATNVYILYFTYSILGGTAYSLLIMASSTCVATQHDKHRSLALGLGISGSGVGTTLFSPLVSMLYNEYSWKDACLLLAGLMLQTLVLSLLLRPAWSKDYSLGYRDEIILSIADSDDEEYEKNNNADPENAFLKNATHEIAKPTNPHLYASISSQIAMYQSAVSLKHAYQSSNPTVTKKQKFHQFCRRFFHDERLCTSVVLSTIFPQCGLSVFVVFLPDFALNRGFTNPEAALLVSAYGISNLAGLLGGGLIGQCMTRGRYYLYTTVVLCTGLVLIATPWFVSYIGLVTCSIIFGFCDGVRICQLPVLLAEYAGPERFGSYVGFSFTLSGVVISVLLPLLGYVSEALQSYTEIFVGTGSAVVVVAITMYSINSVCPMNNATPQSKSEAK